MWGNQSKTDPFGKTFYPVNANAFFIACLLSQFEAVTMKCNHCDAAFRATRKAHSRIRVCARARVYKQTCGNASYVVIRYNVALFQQISIVATCGSFVFTTYTEKYIGK